MTETGSEQRAMGVWQDYAMFKEVEEMKGLHDEGAIQARWHQALLAPGARVMKFQNKTLLWKFQGIEASMVQRCVQQNTMGSKRKITSREDLDAAVIASMDAQELILYP